MKKTDSGRKDTIVNPTNKAIGRVKREIKSPVSNETVLELQRLEKNVSQNKFKVTDLEEIIKIYSTYVEHYEMNKDPISFYFMEKIQLLIANQDTIRALSKIEQVKKGAIPESEEEYQVERRDTIQEMRQMVKDDLKQSRFVFDEKKIEKRHSINTQKRVRAKEMGFNMKLQSQIDKKDIPIQKDSFNKIENKKCDNLKSHRDISSVNDTLVNNNLHSQEDRIKARLRERQQASINKTMSKYAVTHNMTMLSPETKQDGNNSMLDNTVLKGLNKTTNSCGVNTTPENNNGLKKTTSELKKPNTSEFDAVLVRFDSFEELNLTK